MSGFLAHPGAIVFNCCHETVLNLVGNECFISLRSLVDLCLTLNQYRTFLKFLLAEVRFSNGHMQVKVLDQIPLWTRDGFIVIGFLIASSPAFVLVLVHSLWQFRGEGWEALETRMACGFEVENSKVYYQKNSSITPVPQLPIFSKNYQLVPPSLAPLTLRHLCNAQAVQTVFDQRMLPEEEDLGGSWKGKRKRFRWRSSELISQENEREQNGRERQTRSD